MPRTHDEIIARLHAVKDSDWLGTQSNDLLVRLPFELAQPFLKAGAKIEDFANGWPFDDVDPMARAKDYLPFAWDKANNCRGISAGRSIEHFMTWLWLAGKDKQVALLNNYDHYGKPQLVMVSVMCDFDWRKADNGEWVNEEDGPSLSRGVIDAMAADQEVNARD